MAGILFYVREKLIFEKKLTYRELYPFDMRNQLEEGINDAVSSFIVCTV